MPTTVDVPGRGLVEFPDEMSQDQIKATIKRKFYVEPAIKASTELTDSIYKSLTSPAAGESSEMGRQESVRDKLAFESRMALPASPKLAGARGMDLSTTSIGRGPLSLIPPEEAPEWWTPPPGPSGPTQVPGAPAEGTIQTNLALSKSPGTAEKIGRGMGESLLGLGDFMLSPLGIATLGIGGLPAAIQRTVALGFATQMASQTPEIARELGTEFGKPSGERDTTKIAKLITDAATTTGFTIGAGFKGLAPTRIPTAQITETAKVAPLTAQALQQQVTGEALKMPEGAKPETVTKPVERTTPDAIQEQSANAEVLRHERPEVGLSQVGKGDQGVEVAPAAQEPQAPAQQAQEVAKTGATYREAEGKILAVRMNDGRIISDPKAGLHANVLVNQKIPESEWENVKDAGFLDEKGNYVPQIDSTISADATYRKQEGLKPVGTEQGQPIYAKPKQTEWEQWVNSLDELTPLERQRAIENLDPNRPGGPTPKELERWKAKLLEVQLRRKVGDTTKEVAAANRPAVKLMPQESGQQQIIPAERKADGTWETHNEIIERAKLSTEDIDRRIFVDEQGNEKSREQTAQDLAQQGVPTEIPGQAHSTDVNAAIEAKQEVAPESYGQKYVREQGVEGARKRVAHLMKRFDEEAAKGDTRQMENLADEAERIRKALPEEQTPPPATPEPTVEAKGGKPFDIKAAGREAAANYRTAIAAAKGAGAVEMKSPQYPNMRVVITKDPSEVGKWRATRIDEQGPSGHTVYNSIEEAISDYTGGHKTKGPAWGWDFKVTQTRKASPWGTNATPEEKQLLQKIDETRRGWKGKGSIYPTLDDIGITKQQFNKLKRKGLVEDKGFGPDTTWAGKLEFDEKLRESFSKLGKSTEPPPPAPVSGPVTPEPAVAAQKVEGGVAPTEPHSAVVEMINKRDRRDWTKAPPQFEQDAVRAAFNDIKEFFPKKAVSQRIRASKATTFEELRRAYADATAKAAPAPPEKGAPSGKPTDVSGRPTLDFVPSAFSSHGGKEAADIVRKAQEIRASRQDEARARLQSLSASDLKKMDVIQLDDLYRDVTNGPGNLHNTSNWKAPDFISALLREKGAPEVAAESRKPTQILGESARVKVTVPEGATMLRVTDTKGRTSTLSLSEVNKGDNPFHGVEVRKLESGSIGKDKKFNVVKGDVEVEDLTKGPGTGAGPGSPAVGQGPDPKAQIEALEESFRGVAGKKISLLDQIKQASNIGQRASQAKDVLSTAISGLKATGDYLIKKWEGVKSWDDMLRAKGELSAEIEKRGWRVRQFIKTVEKAMPDKKQRAAIAKWVDAGGDKAELERGAAETKPEFRQAYLDAMNLKGDDLIAAQNIRNYFESRLDEAIDAGVLEHGVEDYLHRIYERDPNAAKKMIAYVQAGVIKPNPALAKKRVFQADWEAEKLGYKPVQDFLPRVADYEASLTKAIASRAFIRKTLDMKASDGRPIIDVKGIGIPIEDASGVREATLIKPKSNPVKSNDPADAANYRGDYVNREYPSLSKWKWAGTDAAGKPIFLQGDVAIHPQYVGRIDALLEPSRIRYAKKPLARTVARTAIGISSTVKQTMLDFSGFHQVQITVHGLEHRVLPWKIVQDIDFQNPNVDGLLKGGVTLGGEYYGGNLSEGLVGRSLSRMIPGLGPLMQSYHEWLFQSYIPRIKMTMALHALERNRSRYAGKMSEEQIFAKTAAEANSAFGELNYITLERSQTARDISRIILLAPDFLEARGRFAGGALEKGGKAFGQEQRTALLLGALTMYVTARLVNKATDDQYHFEPENAFSIVHGNKAYGLRTVQGDILHLLERPYQFWLSRLNPVFGRTLLEAATQRDYFGRKRTLPQQAWDAVSTMMPIALRTGRERALWESLLNGFGVTARRWNDVDDAFKLAQEWKKKNLPRSKWEKGEFIYDPDKDALRGLKVALSNGDDGGAVKEIKKLIESKTITHQELNRYFDRYAAMPFTGSQANDRKFLAGLTEDQRKTVTAAREHKKQIRKLYRNAYGQYSDAVNQAAPQ